MNNVPKLSYASQDDPWLKRNSIRCIERLSGRKRIERLYAEVIQEWGINGSFWELAIEKLQLDLEINRQQLAKVPPEVPVLFIANHPFGVLDGIIICQLAHSVRRDFRILINSVLCQEDRIAEYLLPVDFENTREAVRTNIQTKKLAQETLNRNGALAIFPAGGVATAEKPFGKAVDLDWKVFTAKMIQMSKATVVPVYFDGQNSRIFQLVSQFSMTLRLSLLLHEVNNKIGKKLHVEIGDPIPYEELANIKNRQHLTQHLREITLSLQDNIRKEKGLGKLKKIIRGK